MANLIRSEKIDGAYDDARRDFLIRALSTGALAGGLGWQMDALAGLFGSTPSKLPEGKSIFEMKGDVRVDGAPATYNTVIRASDKLETGEGSYVITAVGQTAFILREKSVLEMGGKELFVRSMQLLSGRLLSVFGRRREQDPLELRTPVATIGIRGTGVYTESDPDKSYLCTCYGTTAIASAIDPSAQETLTTRHHDAPRYILAEPDSGKRIIPAPFINHTDLELMTIEAIVGRQVPFGLTGQEYEGPRRDY